MSHDCIIIGAGVIGLSTALKLLRQNRRVTIIERGQAGQESSWAGGGILSALMPWDYAAPVNDLLEFSNRLFPDWIGELENETGIDTEFIQSGMLVLPPFDEEKALKLANTYNLKSSHLLTSLPNEEENMPPPPLQSVLELEKIIIKSITYKYELNQQLKSAWLPEVAQIRNPRLLKALKQSVLQAKGEIREHEEVIAWQKTARAITGIVTTRGQYSADHYIVSAGAWSQSLLDDYDSPEIKPVRGQMLLFKLSRQEFSPIVSQDGVYIIPRKDGHVLVGSTHEEVGFDKSVTLEAKQFLLKKASDLFPQLNEKTFVRQWSGLRPGSQNNIPTISKHPHLENLYLNGGHFRYGLTMAPGSAELLSNMILNLPQPIEIEPYKWQ